MVTAPSAPQLSLNPFKLPPSLECHFQGASPQDRREAAGRLDAAKADAGLVVHGLILGGMDPGSPFFQGEGDQETFEEGWDRPEPEDVRRQRKAAEGREEAIESTMRLFCDELHHFADWTAVNAATAAAARAERNRF